MDIVILDDIYYSCLKNYFFDENIIENNILICKKTSKYRFNGRGNSNQNLILLKLKLD
jgi:hypothetical protein